MSIELDTKNISKVLDNKIVFADQGIPWEDQKNLGYEYRELKLEEKNQIISILEEIKNLVFQIINEISNKNNLITFFEYLGITNASLFFDNYKNFFIKNVSNLIDYTIDTGGSYGHTRILKNNGKIEEDGIYKKSQTFDEFLKKLNLLKNKYLESLNKIKNFSVEETIHSMGYTSLEEMNLYYQKFLELTKTPEYIDFKIKDGFLLLKSSNNLDIKNIIKNKLSFLFDIDVYLLNKKDKKSLNIQFSSNHDNFFLLDKYKIDNFKEFINSYKINIQTDLFKDRKDFHFYFDEKNEKDDWGKFYSLSSLIAYNPGSNDVNDIINNYYKKMTNYSYKNGLYFLYYNFINNEIINPLCNKILELYQKPYEVYKLDKINELSFNFIKKIISNIISDEFYGSSYDFELIKVIFLKKYISKIPVNIDKKLKLEIIKELKENKKIDIDKILKKIDSDFKNELDIISINNILKINIVEVENILLNKFRYFFAKEIKNFISNRIMESIIENNKTRSLLELEEEVDIKPFLSNEQISLLLLSNKFIEIKSTNKPHSYKESLEEINKYLEKKKEYTFYLLKEEQNKDFYFFKKININSIEIFFSNLKKILVKQLQQEELVLQQKTLSKGIIDELKFENINLKDLPIKIPLSDNLSTISNAIKNSLDNSLFNIFESFNSQIFKNFDYIYRYFSIFPDEAETFFNLTDFNQIKNFIIKIFNFINNNKNYEKLNRIIELIEDIKFTKINNKIFTRDQAYREILKINFPIFYNEKDYSYNKNRGDPDAIQFNSYEEYLNKKNDHENSLDQIEKDKHYGVEFLTNFFKDKNLGTKKEKLERLLQISKLIHNFFNNNDYLNILIQSKYFEKSYNKSIFEILNIIGTTLYGGNKNEYEDNNLIDILNFIKKQNPRLIPEGYLSEDMVYCLKYIPQIKTANDLDIIVEKILSGEYSENIRRFKFLTKLANQYSSTVEWMGEAKPKIESVFAPNLSTDTFRFRVLGDLDPYHFSVGVDTDCCQAIGGDGEAAAIDSFINPMAGVVVLEVNNGSIWNLAAQSYFHYAEIEDEESKKIKKAIILDNIEAGNFQEIYERKFGKDFYPKAYAILGSYLKNKGFDIVGCGERFTVVISSNDFKKSSLSSDPRHFEVTEHGHRKYTDFFPKSFFNLLEPTFSFEMPKNINSIETEMTTKSARILDLCIQKIGNKKSISLNKLSKTLFRFGFKKEAADVYRIMATSLT